MAGDGLIVIYLSKRAFEKFVNRSAAFVAEISGSPFYGVIRLYPSDRYHVVAVVNHVKNGLDDLSDLFSL
jgi:hypothetical protein